MVMGGSRTHSSYTLGYVLRRTKRETHEPFTIEIFFNVEHYGETLYIDTFCVFFNPTSLFL